MSTSESNVTESAGLVLFGFDGSTFAAKAIEGAGRELISGRDALVVCVWQPADVGFKPVTTRHFDADAANEVKQAAQETADYGASLARNAGFRAQGLVVEAAPTWKGIIESARQHDVSVIVLGSHRHTGLAGRLLGSVATAVVSHAHCPVLVIPQEH